jgi:hypothetical protein
MKTKTQTSVIALAAMIVLTIGLSTALSQSKSASPLGENRGNTLVGVWESVAPIGVDCQTREPFGPPIRSLYNIAQGGTMTEQNTDEINEGPYRTTGHGIWKRVSGRDYAAAYMHYAFLPDRTFVVIVKVKTSLTLSPDFDSFTENGTYEILDRDGKPYLDESGNPVTGCFSATATRFTF